MTDVQAALGLHQLPRLDAVDRSARRAVGALRRAARGLAARRPRRRPSRDTRHARHLYQVLLEPGRAGSTATSCSTGWPRATSAPASTTAASTCIPSTATSTASSRTTSRSRATISERTLSLPLSPKVTEADQDDVVAALEELLGMSTSRLPGTRLGAARWLAGRGRDRAIGRSRPTCGSSACSSSSPPRSGSSSIDNQSFWADEALTAYEAHLPFGAMINTVVHVETTPPLYFVLIWAWAHVFGTWRDRAALGLDARRRRARADRVPGGAGARLAGARACIAAAFVTFNPFLIWYSQEARAYMLLAAAVRCLVPVLRPRAQRSDAAATSAGGRCGPRSR